MKALEAKGAALLAIELQGALFFGSTERLAQVIESQAAQPISHLVLDLRRVTEVDSTAVRMLSDVDTDLAGRGIRLMLVLRGGDIAERLAELPGDRFPDIDRALERAEDDILGAGAAGAARQRLKLEEVPLLRGFTAEQIARLRPHLEAREFVAGAVIFKEGDPGSHLFLVTQGRASANLVLPGGGIRLATFAPGAGFGELAILDGGPRSATVVADEEVHAFSLSVEAFNTLQAKEPELAVLILTALGRELSDRLRQANRTIHQLEA